MEAQLERAEAPQLLDMLASRLTRGRRRGKKRPLCDSPRDSVKDRPPLPTAAHAADTAPRNRGYAVPKLTPDLQVPDAAQYYIDGAQPSEQPSSADDPMQVPDAA
eukprot:COSAG01_NODE_42905_length_435_cov_0.964286_1_plen_104_part_10